MKSLSGFAWKAAAAADFPADNVAKIRRFGQTRTARPRGDVLFIEIKLKLKPCFRNSCYVRRPSGSAESGDGGWGGGTYL